MNGARTNDALVFSPLVRNGRTTEWRTVKTWKQEHEEAVAKIAAIRGALRAAVDWEAVTARAVRDEETGQR